MSAVKTLIHVKVYACGHVPYDCCFNHKTLYILPIVIKNERNELLFEIFYLLSN